MVIKIYKILTGFALICVSSMALADVEAEFYSNLQVKSGNFTLKYEDQTVQTPVNFDPDSTSFFAIDFEWKRDGKNSALGTEFIKFKNDYAAATDDMTSYLLFLNRKQYIGKFKRVQPFVGGGIGMGVIDSKLSDRVTLVLGSHYQLMAGFKFQFDKVNALIEYKKLIDIGDLNEVQSIVGPLFQEKVCFLVLV